MLPDADIRQAYCLLYCLHADSEGVCSDQGTEACDVIQCDLESNRRIHLRRVKATVMERETME